jgi:hypothetical protein
MTESRLLRHLTLAVLLKLAVLALLWWWFVRDARVDVGPDAMSHRAAAAAPLAASPRSGGQP